MSDPLLRQWEMLKLIPRERKITVKELKNKLEGLGFSVSRRTLERDLDRLSIPFTLEVDSRSKPYGWRYALNMQPCNIPGLTSSEALTLVLLETYLKTLLPVAITDNLAGQFSAARQFFSVEHTDSKLHDWLKKVKVLTPGQPLLSPIIDPHIQRTVNQALMQGLQLEMDYLAANASQAKRFQSVHLQGLVQYGSVIYLVTTINDHNDLRLLVLHRIKKITLKNEPLRNLDGFNLQAYIDKGGFGFGKSSQVITLIAIFKNGVGLHLVETPLAKDQQIGRLDDNKLQITAEVLDTPQLLRWLSSHGADVEVLGPANLRHKLADHHRLAVQQYLPQN
ncbi:helix-turn-helix transcriptional regulator [Methylobacter psychrophilus]|uniref:helix-turn-helix transcriptional regulator n=1 Tax=Methylobacter psychrophilus TaxID=96941 RepID=UPI0021D4DE5E|nr:WYL domain-containing protein [Methylobacter psychrophilus]